MSFEEKVTWVNTVTTVIVVAIYAWVVGGQIAENPVADIAYQTPMLIAVGAIIGLTIAGVIAMAIGTAISAEITGEGSVDDIDRKDERDITINRRGDLVGYYVSSAFMIGALAVTMLDYAHFWIAHAIFAGLLVAGLTSSVVKLVVYRRGY
ncbi:MAG: hypothetical protein PF636_10990 [Actinomycetota bacterium]|jgi:hypothetical protein|nr:hypothetical protein [Actinomycetota bacterium]